MFQEEEKYDKELSKKMENAIDSCWGQNKSFLLEFYMSWIRKKELIINLKTEIERYLKK